MKRANRLTLALMLAPILAAPALPAGELIQMTAEQRQALDVRLVPVEPASDALSPAYPAQVVVPNAQLRVVSAPQAGLLEALLVAEGEPVTAGQPLARIQSPELVEQQSAYLESLTRLELASAQLQRDRQLHKEGIVAERRLLETRSAHTQARTLVNQRRQTLELAGIQPDALESLARERRLSSSLVVRSPLDGVVLEQLATPGQRLEMASPLYKIGQLDPLWLEVHVPLNRLGSTAPGTGVQLEKLDLGARVITVGQMVHGADQGVLVRAEISAGAGRLRPGQFVQARLEQPSAEPLFRVPQSALVHNEGRTWLLLAEDAGFRPLPVQVRSQESGQAVVSGGLSAGDRVAVSGTAALKAAWLGGGE